MTVDLEVPAHALAGGPRPDAVVRTTGAPAGTAVTLQRLSGTHWLGVAAAAVDATGTTRVPLPLGDLGPGATAVRAVVSGVISPARDLDVASPGAILTPEDDSEVDGPVDVEIEVAAGLTATQVRLYLDGFVLDDLAEPVPGEPGHWQATVDPASVPLTRRHVDLVARVTTADGSALTDPVRLDLLPTTGGLPPGFRVDTVASGLDLPTSFAPLDEDRMLVTEKAGLVRLAVDGLVRPTPVLDLRGVVSDTADSGILAVALDPDFAANGWFYLSYVVDDGGGTLWHTNRVVRYTLDGEVADPASAHVVLGAVPLDTCLADQTTPGCLATHGAHTVDDLLFAADGSLLVSVGDGAPGQPVRAVLAQRLDVLVGKVLRVDPDTGLGLADNPYFVAGQPGANRSRVWAYGFRNPFRMAFSPAGDLYVGDVGEVAWEEVDRVVAGGNYGWPCFEGVAGPGTAPAGDPDCEAVRTGARRAPHPAAGLSARGLLGLDHPRRVRRRRRLPRAVPGPPVPRRLHPEQGLDARRRPARPRRAPAGRLRQPAGPRCGGEVRRRTGRRHLVRRHRLGQHPADRLRTRADHLSLGSVPDGDLPQPRARAGAGRPTVGHVLRRHATGRAGPRRAR